MDAPGPIVIKDLGNSKIVKPWVDLVSVYGDDLMVVNAARASYDKQTAVFRDSDERLIRYLWKHEHVKPFAHPQLTFRVHVPIYVARQLMQHQVGFVHSEVSRRYVSSPPMFAPLQLRKTHPNKKQGSLNEEVKRVNAEEEYADFCYNCALYYRSLLEDGVAEEVARAVLPLSMFTTIFQTGSLLGWLRMMHLRLQEDAQTETREVVQQIAKHVEAHFPVTMAVFNEE